MVDLTFSRYIPGGVGEDGQRLSDDRKKSCEEPLDNHTRQERIQNLKTEITEISLLLDSKWRELRDLQQLGDDAPSVDDFGRSSDWPLSDARFDPDVGMLV